MSEISQKLSKDLLARRSLEGHLIVHNELIRRGWRAEWIEQFLDVYSEETNPHDNSQKMKLYLLDDVKKIELSNDFALLIANCYPQIKSFVRRAARIKQKEKCKINKMYAKIRRTNKRERIALGKLGLI